MKAAVLIANNKLEIKEISKPKFEADEVLVRSRAVGVCGSDIHIMKGEYHGINHPLVMGHEACGEIAEIGADVDKVNIGDRVVVDPILWCGTCYFCKKGMYNICALNGAKKLIGYSQDGAYAEYFVAPERNLHKMSSKLDFKTAALVDTLACPINAINKISFDIDETVIVIGAGSSGLLFVQLMKMIGIPKIIVVEPNDHRRKLAENLGADLVYNPQTTNFLTNIEEELPQTNLTTIDAAGTEESVILSLKLARKRSTLLHYGYVSNSLVNNFDMGKIVLQELRLIGSVGYNPWNYEEAIKLLESNRIVVDLLITHTFSLNQILDALELVQKQGDNVIKAVILQ